MPTFGNLGHILPQRNLLLVRVNYFMANLIWLLLGVCIRLAIVNIRGAVIARKNRDQIFYRDLLHFTVCYTAFLATREHILKRT